MKKEGQIWISAVIYIALGVIAIALLAAAAVPLVKKMRDRNTFEQTKDLMSEIDDAIRQVVAEGPGSQRFLSPINIKKGELYISGRGNDIQWTMETKAVLQEPNSEIESGGLILRFDEDELIKDQYDAEIAIESFTPRKIILYVNGVNDGEAPDLTGTFSITITNNGILVDSDLTIVNIVVN